MRFSSTTVSVVHRPQSCFALARILQDGVRILDKRGSDRVGRGALAVCKYDIEVKCCGEILRGDGIEFEEIVLCPADRHEVGIGKGLRDRAMASVEEALKLAEKQ